MCIKFLCEFSGDDFRECCLGSFEVSVQDSFSATPKQAAKIIMALQNSFNNFDLYLNIKNKLVIRANVDDSCVSDSIKEMSKEAVEITEYVQGLLTEAGCDPCDVIPVVEGLY